MNSHEMRLPADDEPLVMTAEERSVWVYLIGTVISTGVYAAVVVPRAIAGPIDEVSWVPAMLWTIGVTIAFTIVGTIVASIGSAVGLAARGRDPEFELTSDLRDKEIEIRGHRASMSVVGVGVGVALVVTMLDLDHFWIGHAIYASGFVGALVEAITKIRLYRRGF